MNIFSKIQLFDGTTMRGPRKLCQRSSNFDIFLVDEGREDQNTTIGAGPSLAHQRNTI